MSLASMGLAAIRQFIYPPIGLLSLGFYIYTALPYMKYVEKSLRKDRKVNVDVLFFIGDTLTLAISQYFTASVGVFLIHSGKIALEKTRDSSKEMIVNFFEQQPRKVWVFIEDVEIETPLEDVKVNDIVIVHTGEVIPIDGIIVKGMATIDQHALTGEFQPAEKIVGDQVFASTVMMSGKLSIKVEKSGEDTTISKIAQVLKHSTDFKSSIQLKGEKWADKSTLPMVLMSGLMLPILGAQSTVVFINSHIGNRIRVLAPMVTLNHILLASHKGILVKDGRVIEILEQVDTILFDKTGTLTNEEPEVGQIIVSDIYTEIELLTLAAATERKFTHPIARAILNKANELNLTLPDIDDSKYHIGYGITVKLDNKTIKIGSTRFIIKEGIVIPERIKEMQDNSHNQGYSLVLVAINDKVSGAIELKPQIREEVKKTISDLRCQGIKFMAIVSGDHKEPTKRLAEELNMDDYFYDTLPENKAQIVELLQKEGKSVCFVGDGINDTIAMKKANVSISLRGASTIASDTAGVILMDGNMSHLCELIDISKRLHGRLQSTLKYTIIPGVINLVGAFFLHYGILFSILISATFASIGMKNVYLPLKEIPHPKETNGTDSSKMSDKSS
ncbi:MAG: heavy metal translocating P-type ATPase [Thiomargarita sp.]|nr:heavy metal translocating P-type ATPase [Thiomargarita sp.]